MWHLVLAIAVVQVACIEPNLVVCGDGLACSANQVCDEQHRRCVLPSQLAACTGMPDGVDCVADTVTGGCFDGVCLARGCGNGIVEADEVCDDGNQTSGDGCRGDCRSNETCGNGVVDSHEDCDDGNLISRDGCDSRCLAEQTTWTTVGIAPGNVFGGAATYDPVRHKLVVARSPTWEWDGATWRLTAATMVVGYTYFDSDRGRVVVVTSSLALYDWDGTQWTPYGAITAPSALLKAVTYDRSRHRPMVFLKTSLGAIAVWTVDATGTATQLPTEPALPGAPQWSAGFDPLSNAVVVIAADGGGTTSNSEASFDGTTWTTTTTALGGGGLSLAIDEGSGRLVAVENASLGVSATRGAGGVWTLGPDPSPCKDAAGATSQRALYYDTQQAVLTLLDGHGVRICKLVGGAWIQTDAELPFAPTVVVPDPRQQRLLVIHDPDPVGGVPSQMWAWTGTWQRLPAIAMPPSRVSAQAVYDETRGAAILYGGQAPLGCTTCTNGQDTWAYDGSVWSLIDNSGPVTNGQLTYDPSRRSMILSGGGFSSSNLYRLTATATSWVSDGPGPASGPIRNLSWDPSNHDIAALTLNFLGGYTFEDLIASTWTDAKIAPSGAFSMVADERARALVLIGGDVWERHGAIWTTDATLPLGGTSVGYDPADGQIMVVAYSGTYDIVIHVRDRTSPTPLETCVAGIDADGDGLAGCADPDCWYACPSPCPPQTTCGP